MIKLELTKRQCYEIANLLENSLEGCLLNPESIQDLQKKTLKCIYDALTLDLRSEIENEGAWPIPMSLDTPVGAKVRFLDDVRMGSDYDRKIAWAAGLDSSEPYTVSEIEVEAWSSAIWLEEVPNVSFATVMFENLK